VRRRTLPMVCFVNAASVDRIIFSIFNRFHPQRQNPTLLLLYTNSLTSPQFPTCVESTSTYVYTPRLPRLVFGQSGLETTKNRRGMGRRWQNHE
jgi:hypothetical protein